MESKRKRSIHAQQYDKILKENLLITLPTIMAEVLKLNIVTLEDLPSTLQQTKERIPDLIKKVTDDLGNTYLLHIEFQVGSEKDMVFRMAEYYIMLYRKYKLEIKQYVLLLRDTKPEIRNYIQTKNLFFKFELVSFETINYKVFLNSKHPEVKMFAVLADLSAVDSYELLRRLAQDLNKNSEDESNKFFNQLRIFIQLRSHLEDQLEKAMESISKFFKEEKDFLYRKGETRGEAKGEENKSAKVVKNLVLKLRLSDKEIADLVDVPLSFVENIRRNLKP